MITCPQCGTQNLPGMAYCEHCGSPLSVPEQQVAPGVAKAPAGDPDAAAAIAQAQSVLAGLDSSGGAPQDAAPAAQADAQDTKQEAAGTAASGADQQDGLPDTATPLDAGAPASSGSPVLTILFPDGATYAITGDVTNVGRSDIAQNWHPELDLIPFGGGSPDLGVSRHQAVINRTASGYSIIDVGSTNGTFVNGRALEYNKPIELHDGDAIAFGAFNVKAAIG